jgi:hypothetical protein
MGNFEETLQNIDGFCKIIVKKMPENTAEREDKIVVEQIENPPKKSTENEPLETGSSNNQFIPLSQVEEPLIDVFEEEEYLRILVQCHCREQQVKFYVHADGIRICRESCHAEADGAVVCVDACQKINLRTDRLQLENRLFVVAQCNNNEVLEAMIPKKKKQ